MLANKMFSKQSCPNVISLAFVPFADRGGILNEFHAPFELWAPLDLLRHQFSAQNSAQVPSSSFHFEGRGMKFSPNLTPCSFSLLEMNKLPALQYF